MRGWGGGASIGGGGTLWGRRGGCGGYRGTWGLARWATELCGLAGSGRGCRWEEGGVRCVAVEGNAGMPVLKLNYCGSRRRRNMRTMGDTVRVKCERVSATGFCRGRGCIKQKVQRDKVSHRGLFIMDGV